MMCEKEKAFNRAIAKFDFNAVHACMKANNWRWYSAGGEIPTIDMLIDNVIDLWDACKTEQGDFTYSSSGGFSVGYEDGYVYIRFTLDIEEDVKRD